MEYKEIDFSGFIVKLQQTIDYVKKGIIDEDLFLNILLELMFKLYDDNVAFMILKLNDLKKEQLNKKLLFARDSAQESKHMLDHFLKRKSNKKILDGMAFKKCLYPILIRILRGNFNFDHSHDCVDKEDFLYKKLLDMVLSEKERDIQWEKTFKYYDYVEDMIKYNSGNKK